MPNYTETIFIILILCVNGLFGFIQDYQATRSIEELKELTSPDATVIRDGTKKSIDAKEIVPGDIIYLNQGDTVPADARLLEVNKLRTNESTLTGESTPVEKTSEPLDKDTSLAERENMVYMNTTVVKGKGKAIVVKTGMETEVGDIATQLDQLKKRKTPSQKEVNKLGKNIGYVVVSLIILITLIQFFLTNINIISILLVGITLAVAGVPEGLPAVVTFTLALGSKEMAKRNAVVRRLPVVESLGSVDVIVTDKTGTLTENQMKVTRLYTSGEIINISQKNSNQRNINKENPKLEINFNDNIKHEAEKLLRCGRVCNSVEITEDGYKGDPTEIALYNIADQNGIDSKGEKLREIQFSSERKRMTVVISDRKTTAYTKGAPEVILDRCNRILENGEVRELTEEKTRKILELNKSFAEDALRVLGFAMKDIEDPKAKTEKIEEDMVFLGLQGMIDPPREGVEKAISDCRSTGIRPVLVTGDNLVTARAIGDQIGFNTEGALSGNDLEDKSDRDLSETVEEVDIYARVDPEHKVKILSALQNNGHNVAMTGDGVNDAPALRKADIGVSMGDRGTDVAREASDMVLLDDNFKTIRDAIEEGRGIFENVRKFVNYLVSTNIGEVLVVFFGILLGDLLFPGEFIGGSEALILTPVLILWINIVADTLPALALGADPHSPNIMDRSPRPIDEGVINTRVLVSIITIALLLSVIGLGVFFYGVDTTSSMVRAQTMLFTFIVVVELVRIQIIRSRYGQRIWSNLWLLGAIGFSFFLHFLVLYTPIQEFFNVVPLSLYEWLLIVAGFTVFLISNILTSSIYSKIFKSET